MVKPKNKQDHAKIYIGVIIALVVVVMGLVGGLAYAIARVSFYDESKYLAVYEHLMQRYPELKCSDEDKSAMIRANDGEEEPSDYNRVCVMTDYGISKDGDPYVSYTEYKYDKNTHEKIDEGTRFTLYFQDRGGHYAEALGYDE